MGDCIILVREILLASIKSLGKFYESDEGNAIQLLNVLPARHDAESTHLTELLLLRHPEDFGDSVL